MVGKCGVSRHDTLVDPIRIGKGYFSLKCRELNREWPKMLRTD